MLPESLSGLGEFGFIRRATSGLPGADLLLTGVGDDCAVVRAGQEILLVTCDAAVEGVHFSLDFATPEEAGWRVCAAAISDIAAMGGKPLYLTVALALPLDTPLAVAEGLFTGIREAARAHGAVIAGGDTTRSKSGIFVDIAVTGVPCGRYLLRKGVVSGDALAVTGYPGGAAAGLRLLQADAPGARAAHAALVAAHLRPRARLAAGQWLAAQPEVHAMMDVSDGLGQDTGHLCSTNALGADLSSRQVPLSPALRAGAAALGASAMDFALRGGDDYELLVALDAGAAPGVCAEFQDRFALPLTVIGTFWHDTPGVRVDGEPMAQCGFDHFRES